MPVPPGMLSGRVGRIEDGRVGGKYARDVFREGERTGDAPLAIVGRKGVRQISDEAVLWEIVDRVVGANQKQAASYQAGKDSLFGFFVGQVMKETQGRANPTLTAELLRRRLGR